MVYRFRNRFCPVCGKSIGSYFYALVDGQRVCLSCYESKEINEDEVVEVVPV